ncbi:hypothetical protein O9929_11365 [Vibrio lentus]|nr:hypothetical protein [Vibrio lentus]
MYLVSAHVVFIAALYLFRRSCWEKAFPLIDRNYAVGLFQSGESGEIALMTSQWHTTIWLYIPKKYTKFIEGKKIAFKRSWRYEPESRMVASENILMKEKPTQSFCCLEIDRVEFDIYELVV